MFSGVLCDPYNPEHVQRTNKSYVDAMGDRHISNHFENMLSQVRHAKPLVGVSDIIPSPYRVLRF